MWCIRAGAGGSVWAGAGAAVVVSYGGPVPGQQLLCHTVLLGWTLRMRATGAGTVRPALAAAESAGAVRVDAIAVPGTLAPDGAEQPCRGRRSVLVEPA
jgi:hypothetical protein